MDKIFRFQINDNGRLLHIEADSAKNIHYFDQDGVYLKFDDLSLYLKSEILDRVEEHFFHLDKNKDLNK